MFLYEPHSVFAITVTFFAPPHFLYVIIVSERNHSSSSSRMRGFSFYPQRICVESDLNGWSW